MLPFVREVVVEYGNIGNTQLPQQLVRQLRGSSGVDIDQRYLFVRRLGGGREGAVSLYHDTSTDGLVAIKRFQSVYRNPVPEPIREALEAEDVNYWPAEIPATILLGGLAMRPDTTGPLPKRGLEPSTSDVLPALDYFLVRGSSWSPASLTWHLATPYLGKGTLMHLANNLATKNWTFGNLDQSLRPALHRLLGSLARLHRMGVCHNDVKPDNIYVEDELYWLLGDLGNVREIHHPYYSTPQWHREGQWHLAWLELAAPSLKGKNVDDFNRARKFDPVFNSKTISRKKNVKPIRDRSNKEDKFKKAIEEREMIRCNYDPVV
ncbi:MAG: hypothetical protein LQ339_006640 [Xanthoria mediterranea]|nr:MAG: hypothetical protein LQ339_006640 [Xanthoria mediterranea]